MFHELPKGGGQRAVYEIAKRFAKKKVLVDLYTTQQIANSIKKNFNKVYQYPFHAKIWQGRNWKRRIYKDFFELLKLYFLHRRIARDINNRQYDLTFVNASEFIEAPFILRFLKKSVFYCHDPHDRLIYDPLNKVQDDLDIARKIYERVKRFIRKKLDKQNFLKANVIIANSYYTKKIVKRTYGRESIVAYLGVDTKIFTPNEKEKNFDILFIGSTSPLDGFSLFLEITRLLPKGVTTRTVLVEQEWIDDTKKLRDIYQSSKILLALAVREPFGLIPLEAMACGVPVIAVDEAGYKESVANGKTGYLVRRDAKKIATKIKNLLSNPRKLHQMEIYAREHSIQNWTWEKSVDRVHSIFMSL